MLPHAQRDLHQSLPQRDQALDECFNLVPDECMAIENHRENRSFQLDSLHVHAIIKASLFCFFLFVLNNHKDSDMHLLVSWFLCILLYSSNPRITRKTCSPFVRYLAMNNYDSFMWTVDTPPSMLQG